MLSLCRYVPAGPECWVWTMPDPSEELEFRRRELALREAEFQHRKAQEDSFPRKWGAVLFGAMSAVVVALISAAVTYGQFRATMERTRHESDIAHEEARIENARAALALYFDHIDLIRTDTPEGQAHFALIAAVMADDGMKRALLAMRNDTRQQRIWNGTPNSEASIGLPSLPVSDEVRASDYTVYVQYPARCRGVADEVQGALRGAGFRVPGIDAVEDVPDVNQIRYYGAAQMQRLDNLVLGALASLDRTWDGFDSLALPDPALPGDILEVWLGENCG